MASVTFSNVASISAAGNTQGAQYGLRDYSSDPNPPAGTGRIFISVNGFNPHSIVIRRQEIAAAFARGKGLFFKLGNAKTIPHEHYVNLSHTELEMLLSVGRITVTTQRSLLHRHELTFEVRG